MDDERARTLIQEERRRVEGLIADLGDNADADRQTADRETGDIADPAEPLTQEGFDDAVLVELRARIDALDRAEKRLREGTYGRSVVSGLPISDERLEADPAAELTVDEAEEQS
jgi:DnaK suppressor protein